MRMRIDKVLRAQRMKNKADGPADCLVTEIWQNSAVEAVHDITHWLEKRFPGNPITTGEKGNVDSAPSHHGSGELLHEAKAD